MCSLVSLHDFARSGSSHVHGSALSDAFHCTDDASLDASLAERENRGGVAAYVAANARVSDVGVDEDADGDADWLVANFGRSADPIAVELHACLAKPVAPVALVAQVACGAAVVFVSVEALDLAKEVGPPVQPALAKGKRVSVEVQRAGVHRVHLHHHLSPPGCLVSALPDCRPQNQLLGVDFH